MAGAAGFFQRHPHLHRLLHALYLCSIVGDSDTLHVHINTHFSQGAYFIELQRLWDFVFISTTF